MKLYELITEKAIRISNDSGDTDVILRNPSPGELKNWVINRSQKKDRFSFESGEKVFIKGIWNDNDMYIWNAYWSSHSGAFKNLSLAGWDNSYFFYATYVTEFNKFSDVKFHLYTNKEPRNVRKQVENLFR